MGNSQWPEIMAVIKLSGGPLVNIAGAYVPAWLFCVVAGFVGTGAMVALLQASRYRSILRPGFLMLPALFVIFTFGTWLLLFSAS